MVVKVNIEQKINILGGVLSTNGVGMTEPLVDRDGYPRNDIDVYQVCFSFSLNAFVCTYVKGIYFFYLHFLINF